MQNKKTPKKPKKGNLEQVKKKSKEDD